MRSGTTNKIGFNA